MTKLIIDLADALDEFRPDDKVVVWSPVHREGSRGQVVNTREKRIPLTSGTAEAEVEPGPLMVQIQCMGISDTQPKEVVVPDQASVTLWDLLEKIFGYTPPVVDRSVATIEQAGADALAKVDAAVDARADAIRWVKGPLATGVSVDTLIGADSAGLRSARSSTPGLPKATPGTIEVTYDSSSGRTSQKFTPSSNLEIGSWQRVHSGGAWTAWIPAQWVVDEISSGNVDTIVDPGYYQISSFTNVAGLPTPAAGTLEVLKSGTVRTQRYTAFSMNMPVIWQRVQRSGKWLEWSRSTPYISNMVWSTATRSRPGGDIMAALTKDRRIGLNNFTHTLRITTDDGISWTDVHTFSGMSMESVTPLSDGEILVSTTDGNQYRRVYRSTGFATDPVGATWNVVLGPLERMVKIAPGWSISEHENIVIINEYGPKAGMSWGDVTEVAEGKNARYTYLSTDYGKTFTRIFDLNAWLTSNGLTTDMRHLHGVAWDRYWNRIWLSFGDGMGGAASNGVLYSDDMGATWQTAYSSAGIADTWQVVGILPMKDYVLFAGDMTPSGLMRVDRSAGKLRSDWKFEVAYQHPVGKHLCHSIDLIEIGDGRVAGLFAFSAEGEASPSFVIGTEDGRKIDVLWEDSENQSPGMGLRSIVGPTQRGNLIAAHNDLRVSGQWTEVSGRADVPSPMEVSSPPPSHRHAPSEIVGLNHFSGTGSPEGVVAAPVGSIYVDTAATTGAIRWIKTSGTGSTGWAVEYGDTGWRDITSLITPAPASGRLLVARDAGEMRLYFDQLTMAAAGSGTIGQLPLGLRPEITQGNPVQGVSSRVQISSVGYVQIYSWTTAAMVGTVTAKIPAGWPTTYPGTPT